MTDPHWFDDLPVIGALPPAQQAVALRALGETELAEELEEVTAETYSRGLLSGIFKLHPWQHTAHAFGHFAGGSVNSLPIYDAGRIDAVQFAQG